MRSIDSADYWQRLRAALAAASTAANRGGCAVVFATLGACSSTPVPPWPAQGATPPPSRPPAAPAAAPVEAAIAKIALPKPLAARSWQEFKRQAALRMVAANPEGSYVGEVPEPLLAIPVLAVELNADGSVRKIEVLRVPQAGATDTVEMAIAAVKSAAPYGEMVKLPRPWRFTEAFLYDDERRFKPRTLDE